MVNFCPGLQKFYCDSAWGSEDSMSEALVSDMSGVCVDMYITCGYRNPAVPPKIPGPGSK